MKKLLLLSLSVAALTLAAWAKCENNCCKRGQAQGATVAATPDPAKVKDPVCGMEVDAAKDVKAEHGGKTYYFCSRNCKQRFEKNPAEYTGQAK